MDFPETWKLPSKNVSGFFQVRPGKACESNHKVPGNYHILPQDVRTPGDDSNFEYVAPYCNISSVHLQTEVEALRGKPAEGGQHGEVHHGCHNLTTHRATQICHKVIDEEGEI